MELGYCIITGGTDCHIVHVDLKKSPGGLSGGKGEFILEAVGISCNKNTVPGDQSALNPSGNKCRFLVSKNYIKYMIKLAIVRKSSLAQFFPFYFHHQIVILFYLGVRFGTPALTTRGMTTENMTNVVQLIHSALQLGVHIQTASGPKLADFRVKCGEWSDKIDLIKSDVEKFASSFMLPGQPVL